MYALVDYKTKRLPLPAEVLSVWCVPRKTDCTYLFIRNIFRGRYQCHALLYVTMSMNFKYLREYRFEEKKNSEDVHINLVIVVTFRYDLCRTRKSGCLVIFSY